MLRVMLCGASDIERVSRSFAQVVGGFDGEAWQFLDGRINYLNSRTATWEENSAASVRAADLVVFVIIERYGSISWDVELTQALDAGKPTLILCLSSTYASYQTLRSALHDDLGTLPDTDQRRIVEQLRSLETDRQLTIVQFHSEAFGACLQREMSSLFARGLSLIEQRQGRAALSLMLTSPENLRSVDWPRVAEIALDEFEPKQLRKHALLALAIHGPGLDEDQILSLVDSPEQGVQRLLVARLPALLRTRPVSAEFVGDLMALVTGSDDIGLMRRAIPALVELSLPAAVSELTNTDLSRAGLRRRVAEALLAHRATLMALDGHVIAEAARLLTRCVDEGATEPSWKSAVRRFISDLGDSAPSTA